MAETGQHAFTPAFDAHDKSGDKQPSGGGVDHGHLLFSTYEGTNNAPPRPIQASEAAQESPRAQIERELSQFADAGGRAAPNFTTPQLIHDLGLPERSSENDVLDRLRTTNRLLHCTDENCTPYTRRK